MNILFISYWGINEGLTSATVIPHVKLLTTLPKINKVFLATVERSSFQSVAIEKVEHIPLVSKSFSNVFVNKIADFIRFPNKLQQVVEKNNIGLIICRSSLAGGIGHLVAKKTGVPYVVESFEPHADYMTESGVWKKYDPRYWIEKYFQKAQAKSARFLMPVANNYAKHLLSKNVPAEKIIMVPCIVDLNQFVIDKSKFKKENSTVGVYVGKFGGLYFEDEAFQIFSLAKKIFLGFNMLVLTPSDQDYVSSKLRQVGFSENEFNVLEAPHEEVPNYLATADFAFATYKPSESKKFLSPIKVGEYWACGLPVLLTKGVGDDSEIIEQSGCGATFLFNPASIQSALESIRTQLRDETVRERNRALAMKYRNSKVLKDAYEKVLDSLQS